MFIGHYGAALAIASRRRAPGLGALFVAVQWVDFLFMAFVLLGVERVRIVPGFTAINDFDLIFMPYTHSVVAHVVWALLAAIGARLIARWSWRTSGLLALAVFSHFILDVVMHTPDMPLAGDGTTKLGLGLWNHLAGALLLEGAVFVGGAVLYLRARRPPLRMVIFFAVLTAILVAMPFAPRPRSDTELAIQALVAYAILAGVAAWLARKTLADPDTDLLEVPTAT